VSSPPAASVYRRVPVLRILWVGTALAAVLGLWATHDDNRVAAELRARGVTAPAVVADVQTEITRGGGTAVDWVEVTFVDAQGRHDVAYLNFSKGVPDSTAPGDRVDIVYDPANPPATVLLTRQLDVGFLNGYGPTVLAGVGTLTGVALWVRSRRRKPAPVADPLPVAAPPPTSSATAPNAYFT
jgi:hypothetical protein